MEKSQMSLQLRQVVVSMLNEFAHSSLNVDVSDIDNKWFGQQICFLVENNFLTFHEVDNLFGWRLNNTNTASDYVKDYNKPDASSMNRARMPADEIQRRVMALIGVVSVKYKLSVLLQISEPVAHVVTEVIQEKTEAKWHVPLVEFEWFRDLSVRARNGIKNFNCHTLGDLVVLTPKELRIPNFGPKSKEEVIQALKFEGFWLGMLTRQEYSEYIDKYEEQER